MKNILLKSRKAKRGAKFTDDLGDFVSSYSIVKKKARTLSGLKRNRHNCT